MASAGWEKRNAAARAKGYASYYDYRAHDYGRQPPSAPRARGEALRRLRGHAGPSDLQRLLSSGRIELINVVQTGYDPPTFDLLCTLSDGSQRSFTLRGEAAARRFRDTLDAAGADAPQITGSPKGRKELEEDAELEAEIAAAQAEEEAQAEQGETPADFSDDDIPF